MEVLAEVPEKIEIAQANVSVFLPWETQAFQLRGHQEDYDAIMSVEESSRETAFEALKNSLEVGQWAAKAFQLRGRQEDYDAVMAVPDKSKTKYENLRASLGEP